MTNKEPKHTPGQWRVGKQYEMDNGDDALPIEHLDIEICTIK